MTTPLVGIIMGSRSDADTMRAAAEVLDQFGVPHEFTVVSAHRTPDLMVRYAEEAAGRGLHVIIAGAGGAAHLPGMVAAKTRLPVIGVPVQSKALNGLDSLLSIVQMPRGIPVATVAIGNSANAALLAVRILAVTDPALAIALDAFHERQAREALEPG
jgi:5-(carboxyamino)imidazole ribonucleotide mutase